MDSNYKSAEFYPIPEGIDNMLFYIQRSVNANTIVYALNTDDNGKVIEETPIKVYWVKYEKGGKVTPLTFIQKHYSYGIETTLIDKEKKTYTFEFASYHKRKLYLKKSSIDNKYHVYGQFNNELSVLNRVMIQIEGGTFWIPNITQVEVYAQNITAHKPITEIIKP